MSKVNEYRDKIAANYADTFKDEEVFSDGFDACMDLRIGEKFAEWKEDNVVKQQSGLYVVFKNNKYILTLPELYDYYIENIYQP